MQATVSPIPAPEVPAAPAPLTIIYTNPDGTKETLPVPLTAQQVANIKSQRSELSRQLNSAADRRHRLSEEIKSAPDGASRQGLEQRIAVLDKRIVQLESDIASTGEQLAAAPHAITREPEAPVGSDIPDNVMGLSITFVIFVLAPIAFSIARLIWKKTNKLTSSVVQQFSPQVDQRLERLEQGVDAIAIEIERVTEGQRFVTRLLSEQNRDQLPVSSNP